MSKVIFKEFKSIEEIKSKAEFIPKGRIYPVRIIKKKNKRDKYRATAGSNQYALPTKSGYLIFVENNDGYFSSVIKIVGLSKDYDFTCSPYNYKKTTFWKGNHETSESDFLNEFNKDYLRMNNQHS